MPDTQTSTDPSHASGASHGDPAVVELQALLLKFGYLNREQFKSGQGHLDGPTQAAVARVLEGKGPKVPSTPGPLKPSAPRAGPSLKDAAHEAWFYIVQGAETLESLAAKWGVSVASLLAHPENASLKASARDSKHTLRAGDRVAAPRHVHAQMKKAQPVQDSFSISAMVDYLLHLTAQHPASSPQGGAQSTSTPAHKAASSKTASSKTASSKAASPKTASSKAALPKVASSGKQVAATVPLQGYKKTHASIWPKVVLTQPIESAFFVLLPYLPAGVVMTSGYRSDADQERIINEYYAEKQGSPLVTDVEKRRQWLKNEKKLIIAKVGSSPHRTGYAFDLSGAKLDKIQAAVNKCVTEQGEKFPLLNTIVERNQNCLHVNLKPTAAKHA